MLSVEVLTNRYVPKSSLKAICVFLKDRNNSLLTLTVARPAKLLKNADYSTAIVASHRAKS